MTSTAVVFVHGVFSGPQTWDAALSLMERDPDLAQFVALAFGYPSPIAEPDPRRRIPDYDAIADALALFLARDTSAFHKVVLVAHSQGGLIVQRYVAHMLQSGHGVELARISRVIMFACPNDGSDFFLGLRRRLRPWTHVQERQLRPLNERVAEARRVVLERAVYATAVTTTTCPIPFSVYAGLSDNIVKHSSAKGAFPTGGSLPGDHNSIIAMDTHDHPTYRTLKWDLIESQRTPVAPDAFAGSPPHLSLGTGHPAYSALNSLPGQFLECIADRGHDCDFGQPWCRALADNTIPLSNYVVPRVRTFGEFAGGASGSLDKWFGQWLQESRNNLLLLGEYGAGKTSACLYLFRRLCAAYQRDPVGSPLPVYISLDAFSRRQPEGGSLIDLLECALGMPRSRGVIERSAVARQSVYILDGLDEMSANATVAGIRANLSLLKPFFGPHSRILISCRTHLFASATDLETAVTSTGLAGELLTDIRSSGSYLISEIQELSGEEIRAIIGRLLVDENAADVWDELGRYYDLQDLSKRPILLGLVLQSLPVLREMARDGRRIREVDLYRAYIQTWALREVSNKRLGSDPTKKLHLAEEVAAVMYELGAGSIDRESLSEEIRRIYGDEIFSATDFRLFDYETRDASFLTCNLAGEFRFLHRSFYEYFAARAFIGAAAREDHASTWRARWLTQEIASFASQLLTDVENQPRLRAVFDMAISALDPTELWNALHLISLLGPDDIRESDAAIISSRIVPRGMDERSSVLVRQYARVAAKFVSYGAGESLISRVLEIVSSNEAEQADNNDTYINYYGGADAACAAFLNHLKAPMRKYDRRLHIHVLGQLGSAVHIDAFEEIITTWNMAEDQAAAARSIELILTRAA